MIGKPRYLWRLVAASAAVASLLLHVLALAVHVPRSPLPSVSAAAVDLTSVLICTAHGTQSITLDADGNPVAPSVPGDPRSRCPLCNVLGTLALAGPVDGLVLDAPPASDYPTLLVQEACPPGLNTGIHRNRGPPDWLTA
jgi:hypothetical protein